MYPELMIVPMREELTKAGIQELRTAADVDHAVTRQPGTTMIVVNSVCGCAAGRMRPAVRAALQNGMKPDHMYTVFAGQDAAATVPTSRATRRRRPRLPSCGMASWSS